VLAVHGGAKEIASTEAEAHRAGIRQALSAGREVLARGGSALDAVELSVRALEDDPTFNAGHGSALNRTGEVEMDAAIMDGRDLSIGAVGALGGVRNPVAVARLLLAEPTVLIVGEGARAFAQASGAELCEPEAMVTAAQRRELAACDTVGAVALDRHGNLAAATSTGGLVGVPAGRMGDSALPGCGYYADNAKGAVALSGHGEQIMRLLVATRIIEALDHRPPTEAVERGLAGLPSLGGDGGGIAIAPGGEVGWWHNSPHFAVGVAVSDADGCVWLSKDER
jgi:beta-aspartyl-peptidase (threonine type)